MYNKVAFIISCEYQKVKNNLVGRTLEQESRSVIALEIVKVHITTRRAKIYMIKKLDLQNLIKLGILTRTLHINRCRKSLIWSRYGNRVGII